MKDDDITATFIGLALVLWLAACLACVFVVAHFILKFW